MPLFNEATWFLLGIAIVLIILNFFAHRLRKNRSSDAVKIAFIPPRGVSTDASGDAMPMELTSKLDAHVASTNQKINQLHERLVAVENVLLKMQDFFGRYPASESDSFSESDTVEVTASPSPGLLVSNSNSSSNMSRRVRKR